MEGESTPPPSTPESPLKQIRTFEGDIAEAIRGQKESLVSIREAERARSGGYADVGEKRSKKPIIYALLTLTLAVAGGFGARYAYLTYKSKTAPPTIEIPPNQFLKAASVVSVDGSTISRQGILALVAAERGKSRSDKNIEQVALRRGTLPGAEYLSTEDFLLRLNVRAPQSLVRSLGQLFELGVLGASPPHTLLIAKLDSFANAFPGMLGWEPHMADDLLPLFASNATAASVPSSTEFEDITIENRDARVLRDPAGKAVLIYGFFDTSMLVITDTEDAFRIIMERLQSQELSR